MFEGKAPTLANEGFEEAGFAFDAMLNQLRVSWMMTRFVCNADFCKERRSWIRRQ